jgi:DNA mismatch repair protein MutS
MNMIPAMKQHAKGKSRHPGMVVLLRVGDFFETFGGDAVAVSLATDKTVVRRGDFLMIGFPVAKLREYLTKLLKKGHKNALLDLTN